MTNSKGISTGFLVFLCCVVFLRGGIGEWTLTGPPGAAASSFALDAQNGEIFVGTANGVFMSGDGGDSWTRMSQGLVELQVSALAIDPANPLCLYAGVFGGGVYKSVDGAENWAPVNNGLIDLGVLALAVDPRNAQRVFAGTATQGLFASSDGGANWTRIEVDPFGGPVLGAAVAPSDSQILYVAGNGGLFRSGDGGATFEAGRSETSQRLTFNGPLVVDSTNPNLVFAATNAGVARSDDGLSFRPLAQPGTIFQFPANALARDPSNADLLYVGVAPGVLRIGAQGEDPQFLRVGDSRSNNVVALLALGGPGSRLFAAGSIGVFRSDDGGRNWTELTQGLRAPRLAYLALDSFNSQSLLAAGAVGLFQSVDGGSRWRRTGRQFDGTLVRALLAHPANPRIFYAGTSFGVFRSEDGGRTWDSASEGLSERTIWSLAIDPSDPSILYAGTAGSRIGVFRSVNGGDTWMPINPGNLTSPFQVRVAVDPSEPTTLFAGTVRGLFRSLGAPDNWTRLEAFPETLVQSVTVHPNDSSVVFAATRAMGLFRSQDGGDSWARLATTTLHPDVRRAVVDPTDRQKIYAATFGGGVFFSPDGGDSWTAFNEGLDSLFVLDLAINPESDRLYAATLAGFAEYQRSPSPQAPIAANVSVGGNLVPAGNAVYEIVISSNGQNQQGAATAELTQTLPPGLRITALESDSGTVALGPSADSILWRGEVGAAAAATVRLETRIDERASGTVSTRGRLRIGQGESQIAALTDDPAAEGPEDATSFEVGSPTIDPALLAVPFATPLDSTFVGVAVANTNQLPSSETFETGALDANGQAVGQAEAASLGFNEQRAFLTSEVVDQAATVIASNAQGGLSSFFLLGDDPVRRLDGVGAVLRDGQLLYIPDVRQNADETTFFYFFNADEANSAEVTLEAFSANGEAAAEGRALLDAFGSAFASFSEIFGNGAFEGYVRLRANRPIRCFALLAGPNTFRTLAARIPTVGRRAYAPHFFVGFSGGTTELSILNPLNQDVTATVRAFGDGQGLIAEPTLNLPAGRLTRADLGELLGIPPGESVQGFLELELDAGREEALLFDAAFAAVVTYDGGMLNTRSSLPLIARPRLGANFLQVANAAERGIFQGLAIHNTSTLQAVVSVFAYDPTGNVTAGRIVFINPGQRIVGLLDEEVFFGPGFQQSGGYLSVFSTVPVTAYSLFGGEGFLSAVEGQ